MKEKTGTFLKVLSAVMPIVLILLASCKQDGSFIGPGSIADQPNVPIDSINTGDFKTYTQAEWGAPPFGINAPAIYLRDHWNLLDTVKIGCDLAGGKTLTFTNSQAITNFLPQGGLPAPLDSSFVNPNFRFNLLAGQVLTLALNIKFDLADSSFGLSNNHLKDLCVTYGMFHGMTVNQVFTEANKVLGGCTSQFSALDINNAVTRINEDFIDGRYVGPFLHYCNLENTIRN